MDRGHVTIRYARIRPYASPTATLEVYLDYARYVKNKAGLTGQTFPGRRIPGHWPYPAPEELAETEPVTPDWEDVPFFYPLHDTCWPSSVGMAAPTLACRGFGLPALLLGLAVPRWQGRQPKRRPAKRAFSGQKGLKDTDQRCT